MNTLICSRSASMGRLLRRLLLLVAFCLPCQAAVIEYTLPLPFRTSVEYTNAPPAVYNETIPDQMAYPIDFNGDGRNEFVIFHENSGSRFMRLFSVSTGTQAITTFAFEDLGNIHANPYPIPGPPGFIVGPTLEGEGIKWGNMYPFPEADVLGLGAMAGFYTLASGLGGNVGYYSLRWNRLLPSDWDYLGVRFELEDGTHYGYLRLAHERALNGNVAGRYAVLRGWSWETEPGVPITVIPEPGTWVLSASGLLLLRWRGRSQARGGRQEFSSITTPSMSV